MIFEYIFDDSTNSSGNNLGWPSYMAINCNHFDLAMD